jgi:hypothetical protein
LEAKNELLIGCMQKNFGKTHQDLPNFKLPAILGEAQGAKSIMAKQTDVLGNAELYSHTPHPSHLELPGDKSAGILKKTITSVTKSYAPKH